MKLTPAPKIQFFGDDGLPLSGGKVFTYEQGTTTPLATYSDPAGGSVNTNPVILDTYGRASIYIQDLAYTFLVKDADDVVQGAGGDVPNPAIDTTDFLERTSLTGSAEVPVGSTAQRDGSPTQGFFRFNTTIGHFEGYDGTEWVPFRDESDDEPALGNPVQDGLSLLSTNAGVRSWGVPTALARSASDGGLPCDLPFVGRSDNPGGHISVSSNYIQPPFKVWSSNGVKRLVFPTESIIGGRPTGNDNALFYFAVELLDLSVTVKIYTTYDGPDSDEAITDNFRLLFIGKNDPTGSIYSFSVHNKLLSIDAKDYAPIIASTLTTSLASYSVPDPFGPKYFDELALFVIAAGAGTLTLCTGSTTLTYTQVTYASGEVLVIKVPAMTRYYMKYTTGNCAIKIAGGRMI